ncbi:MAG TPA: copper homeostasis protein CutC [Terriglobales bacterium]|nr:copper homeostasis protein CutC [Terriglobales bacterium]
MNFLASREKRILVEIASHCVQSALAAQAGRADRVELLSNPMEGGVTPSEGLIAVVRERISIDLHVMIRPRGGDFCYSGAELETMLHDIETAKRLGANAVVLGAVTQDGQVDVERTRELVAAARPMSVTFHRAIDVCNDLPTALNDVISCGVDRVLTSGGAATALEGTDSLASLVRLADHRITVIAAGHVRAENVAGIVRRSGVGEIHAGLRSPVLVRHSMQHENISFGAGRWFETMVVQERDVRKLVEQVEQL